MIGIYQLTFSDNSTYIGQSSNIERRIYQHKWSMGKGSPKLQSAFQSLKLVKDEVLEECSVGELSEREIYWINKLHPQLNTLEGGTHMSGINHPRSKYSREQILEVVRLFSETATTYADISALTDVKSATVHDICKGRSQTWATSHLDLESIRASRDAKKSITLYSPNNTKYIVDYGEFSAFQDKYGVNLTPFTTGNIVKNNLGWSTYPKPTNKYLLTTDEGLEFIDTKDNHNRFMKDCKLPVYSRLRVLEGFTSKGWSLKEI